MTLQDTIQFISSLISYPSLSGKEGEVLQFLEHNFRDRGWKVERLPVEEGRYNIFVSFGKPVVCFTTHVDIVPAKPNLFLPVVRDEKLVGRGSCDAKGIVGCMVAAASELLSQNKEDFCLLFVVGEEHDGIGAKHAAASLRGRGIQYIVNGEPTEGKLMAGHKGGISFAITTKGKSCHSGYPELGEDANAKLVRIMSTLLDTNLGHDPILGRATINLGQIHAGTADNIVSDSACVSGMVRTVTDNASVITTLKNVVGKDGVVEIPNDAQVVRLKTLPGFEIGVASYCTDIPHFLSLEAECLLYGPGTIRVAHTDHEYVELKDLANAIAGYKKIYEELVR